MFTEGPSEEINGHRAVRRDRARTAILLAASDLSREKGPELLSLRDVANRAGYSPGALYRYFESKGGLMAALAAETDLRAAERLRDVSPGLPPTDRLVRLGLAYVAFAHYEPARFTLLLSGQGRPPGEVFDVFLGAARSGEESGSLRAGIGPEAIAYAVWSFAHGMAVLARTHLPPADLDVDAAQREAMTRLVGSFAASP